MKCEKCGLEMRKIWLEPMGVVYECECGYSQEVHYYKTLTEGYETWQYKSL